MKDKVLEGWLHRCSCRREKQVHSLQESITQQEKILRHIHITFSAQEDLDVRESQSTVNQLTVQRQELQDRINCLNDSRDCKDLETAGSSGSVHVPSHP